MITSSAFCADAPAQPTVDPKIEPDNEGRFLKSCITPPAAVTPELEAYCHCMADEMKKAGSKEFDLRQLTDEQLDTFRTTCTHTLTK